MYVCLSVCVSVRFTGVEDYNWFTKTMKRVLDEEMGEYYGSMVESTHYFVDFLRYSQWLVTMVTAITMVTVTMLLSVDLHLNYDLF